LRGNSMSYLALKSFSQSKYVYYFKQFFRVGFVSQRVIYFLGNLQLLMFPLCSWRFLEWAARFTSTYRIWSPKTRYFLQPDFHWPSKSSKEIQCMILLNNSLCQLNTVT
jgi:hypothetical protein